jgi:hypothetical protein
MVLQDLGRRINAAVSDLTRSTNLDEKAIHLAAIGQGFSLTDLPRYWIQCSRKYVTPSSPPM